MTDKTRIDGETIEIADLDSKHPYAFDTRTTRHEHFNDGTIVRLDTQDMFSGKTLVKRLSNTELEAKRSLEDTKIV